MKKIHGWDKDCGVYQCSDGIHLSWWQAIVRTPEWQAWDEYNRGDKMMYDIPEVAEGGLMSEEHARDFLKFVRTKYHLKEKIVKGYAIQIGSSVLSPRGRKRIKCYLSKKFAEEKIKRKMLNGKIVPVEIHLPSKKTKSRKITKKKNEI